MCGNSKSGFTLIEILVVIALIGLLATVVIPNFRNLIPRKERQTFIGQLNALAQFAWQNALVTHKIHQIVFDLDKKQVRAQMATGNLKEGKPEFGPIKRTYIRTAISIPASLEVKNFIIEGYDEMSRYGPGRKTVETYFYIMPDGLAQSVTINLLDKKDLDAQRKPRQVSLALNPFNAQFKVGYGFAK